MILKGSQRGYGGNLAAHLLNDRENDHIRMDDIRGTAAQDLRGALLEMEAAALGTKCKQPFFQVIVNPPESASLDRDQFAATFDKIEADFGLADHPRAAVYHEKNGREHAHVVYGRMHLSMTYEHGQKAGQERPSPVLKAKQLSHFKTRLRGISQELHRDFDLEMPAGLKDSRDRDPLNFDRATWQQAKRLDEDPRDLKDIIGKAYQYADNAQAFSAALEENAMQLARGDKRGFVIVHHSGEALPLHRYLGVKQKDIRTRLGQPEHVQTVDQARTFLSDKMTAQAERQIDELKEKHATERRPMVQAVQQLRTEQRESRQDLAGTQKERAAKEAKARADRIRSGIAGLWDRLQLRFGAGKLAREFAAEIEKARSRDKAEFQELKTGHLRDRQQLQKAIKHLKTKHRNERQAARSVLGHWLTLDGAGARARIDDHLQGQDDNKRKYLKDRRKSGLKDRSASELKDRSDNGEFLKATERRQSNERGLELKRDFPKAPTPKNQ